MNGRLLRMALAALACLVAPAAWADSYTQAEFDWCRDNMRDHYEAVFDDCVHDDCARINIRHAGAKSACYLACKAEAVRACIDRRGQLAAQPAARPAPASSSAPAAQAVRPTSGPAEAPQTARLPEGIPPRGVAPAEAPSAPAVPAKAAPAAEAPPGPAAAPVPPAREKQSLMDRFSNLFGGGSKPAAAPAPANAATEQATRPAEPIGREDKQDTSFASRLTNYLTGNSAADYTWCRDNSAVYRGFLSDCKRDCALVPVSATSRRMACLSNCRKDAIEACINMRGN